MLCGYIDLVKTGFHLVVAVLAKSSSTHGYSLGSSYTIIARIYATSSLCLCKLWLVSKVVLILYVESITSYMYVLKYKVSYHKTKMPCYVAIF